MKMLMLKIGTRKYWIKPLRFNIFVFCLIVLVGVAGFVLAENNDVASASVKATAVKTPVKMQTEEKAKPEGGKKVAKLVEKQKLTATLVTPKEKPEITHSEGKEMPVYANNSSVKRYMDRSAVTDTSTQNYKICNVLSEVQSDGTLHVNGRTVVAMGQSYGKVGDCFDVTLSSGKILSVIIGDSKKYADTSDGAGWSASDGSLLEFVIDTGSIDSLARVMGDMNYDKSYEGEIVKIIKVGSI